MHDFQYSYFISFYCFSSSFSIMDILSVHETANNFNIRDVVSNTAKTNFIPMLQDFVTGLSILSRGSIDEKLRWTFSLYDINGDGCITREEMTDIVTAVYELMGKFSDPNMDHEGVREKVDRMFQVWIFPYCTDFLIVQIFMRELWLKFD